MIGITRLPVKPWSTKWPKMLTRVRQSLTAASLPPALPRWRSLATVVGQDLETGDDGIFRYCPQSGQGPAISVADLDARHGLRRRGAESMVTKAMWPSTPTARSSPAPVVTLRHAGDASVAADITEIYWATGETGLKMTMGRSQRCTAITLWDKRVPVQARGARPSRRPWRVSYRRPLRTDLGAGTVTCPNNVTAQRGRHRIVAWLCANCPLRDQCTTVTGGRDHRGRSSRKHSRARDRQKDPDDRRLQGHPPKGRTHLATSAPPPTAGGEPVGMQVESRRRFQPTRSGHQWPASPCSGFAPHRADGRLVPDRAVWDRPAGPRP